MYKSRSNVSNIGVRFIQSLNIPTDHGMWCDIWKQNWIHNIIYYIALQCTSAMENIHFVPKIGVWSSIYSYNYETKKSKMTWYKATYYGAIRYCKDILCILIKMIHVTKMSIFYPQVTLNAEKWPERVKQTIQLIAVAKLAGHS